MFLLFPCHTDVSLTFYNNQSAKFQKNIIAYTSIKLENIQNKFYNITSLQDIYSDGFVDQLDQIVNKYKVKAIITSNDFVVQKLLQMDYILPVINIANGMYAGINDFKELKKVAHNYYQKLQHKLNRLPKITENQIIGLLKTCNNIPGQTSLNKILSLIGLFENLPPGDILEIGVLFGRSAVAFGLLAKIYFEQNQLFLIDTWDAEHSTQVNSPEILQNSTKELDWEIIYERFKIEISSVGLNNYHITRGDIINFKKIKIKK